MAKPAQNLKIDELADRLRTSVNTLHYWRSRGYGPRAIKVGKHLLYPLAEVEAWEAAQLAAQNPSPAA